MPKTTPKRSSAVALEDQKKRPSKKAKVSKNQPKPSEVIDDVATKLSLDEFRALLRTHVYPLLDNLPVEQSEAMVAAFSTEHELQQAQPAVVDMINLSGHEKSLADLQKKLNKAARLSGKNLDGTNWIMDDMTSEICLWLDALFPLAIERKTHLDEVYQALVSALKITDKLADTDAYVPFSDQYEDAEWELKKGSGEVVYHTRDIYDIFWKFHRDLICVSIITNNESLVKQIIQNIKNRKDRRSGVLDVVRTNGWAISTDEDEVNQYEDAWFPEDMKAVLPRVRTLLGAALPDAVKPRGRIPRRY